MQVLARRLLVVLAVSFWCGSSIPVALASGWSNGSHATTWGTGSGKNWASSHSAGSGQTAAATKLDFDLSSTAASIVDRISTAVSIQQAGSLQTVKQGELLTPGQYVAVRQVQFSGAQSIQLGMLGNAVGGLVALTPGLSRQISSLVIPQGVTVVDNFGHAPTLNLSGNFVNNGNFYAVSSNPNVSTATISAAEISNLSGAKLTSILPIGGLPGLNHPLSQLSLNLSAINDIINQGSISSSGNLTMSAGGAIVNQGNTRAAQSVSLTSSSGNITNSGLIAAISGNVNISSQMAQSLSINNAGGTIEALNGSIQVSTASAEELGGTPDLSINGGNLMAGELNFVSSQGVVNIDSDTVQGRIDATAGELYIGASTPNLIIGDLNVAGDPTFWNAGGDVTIAAPLTLGPVNLAIIASGNIVSASGAGAIDVSSVGNGCCNAGSILMVAGVNFVSPTSGSGNNDTTTTLVIGGPSANGGMIDLTGGGQFPITSLTTAAGGAGGSVTLVAYYGTSNPPAGSGTIILPSNVTITTGTSQTNSTGLNGSVIIIAGAPTGNAIQIGGINTAGNTINPQAANNGLVIVAAATPTIWGNPGGLPTADLLTGGASFTDSVLSVNSTTSFSTGQTVEVNPLGANGEAVTITGTGDNTNPANGPLGPYITLGALVNMHTIGEAVYVSASSLTVVAGGGTPGPPLGNSGLSMTANGGIFLPGAPTGGNIIIGGPISANNMITVSTSPSATQGNGLVQINGSMSLSMNPEANGSDWQAYPAINITGTAVTIASGVSVSSQIPNCSLCPNTINITTQNLTNSGTVTGGAPSTASFSNAYINISSPGNLTLQGSGSFSVPSFSVIEAAAADGSTLTLGAAVTSSVPSFSTGASGGLVIFDAQGHTGSIDISAANTVTINGGPVVSINTPNLILGGGSQLSASGATAYAIGSGYTQDSLNVSVTGTGNATISTTGGSIGLRPIDGQNLTINAVAGDQLVFSGATALLSTSSGGTTTIGANAVNSGTYTIVSNPAGGILGVEFQPYVGPYISGPSLNNPPEFVAFTAYPFQLVLDLLAPAVAEQQFQVLSTYTQQYSTSYVIGAAKQVGLRVSAGVFVDLAPDGTNVAPSRTTSDIYLSLQSASKYGNVLDIVVGNEDIVAGPDTADPSDSVNALTGIISNVETMRNQATDPVTGSAFTAATLPVTTRQEIGVWAGDVTTYSSFKTLLSTVEGYVYGNVYPFFNESTVVPGLYAGMSQAAFQSLVETNMSAQFDAAADAFVGLALANTPDIHVGETGWATDLLSPSQAPGYGYFGSSLPQQSNQFAAWYYPAMQNWSLTHLDPITQKIGVVIAGYFGLYDEPWKGVDGGAPGDIAVTLSNTVNPTTSPVQIQTSDNAAFENLTPMSILFNPDYSTEELENYSLSGGVVTVGQIVNTQDAGAVLDQGHPEEPFFGLFSSQGVFSSNGHLFTLTGTTLKYTLPVYPNGQPAGMSPRVVLPVLTTKAVPEIIITPGPSNSTALDVQIGTRIATDTTTSGSNPANQDTLISTIASNAGTKPFVDLSGTGAGWTHSASGSVWLCTGCVPAAGSTEHATRILKEAAGVEGDADGSAPGSMPTTSGGQAGTALIAQAGSGNSLSPATATTDMPSFYKLPRGVAFFNARTPLVVGTQEGDVHIAAGALALVVETGHDVAVYNLHDQHRGDIRVVVGQKSLTIPPGKQMVLTRKNDPKFQQVNPGARIAYRNAQPMKLDQGITGFVADFSVPSAMLNVPPLKHMLASREPDDRRVARELLKDSVIMSDVFAAAGPYQTGR